ncbi:MAG: anthranilate synthase component I [Syntrophothermus sp.]
MPIVISPVTYYPSFEEFTRLAASHNLIPVYAELLADTETPVSILLKIGPQAGSFLLESVEGGQRLGRYSFLGNRSLATIQVRGSEVSILENGQPSRKIQMQPSNSPQTQPLDIIRRFLTRYQPAQLPGLPRFFGGAVGYVGYGAARWFEDLPDANPDRLQAPDAFLMLTDTVVIMDHLTRKILVVANVIIGEDSRESSLLRADYDRAVEKIEAICARLWQPLPQGAWPAGETSPRGSAGVAVDIETAGVTGTAGIAGTAGTVSIAAQLAERRKHFLTKVERAKEYIRAGDIFQVVLSEQFTVPVAAEALAVYRVLRSINPSPYLFYLNLGELQLVGSSPEVMVRLEGDLVELRPIAGTRPRGAAPDEDAALAKDLLADAKERAEHVMLVDLGRNDLGRICRYGTVEVNELMTVEQYSHVMHIVSNVRGRLAPGKDQFDVLAATFPAGTVSGAPKIRAMEIVDELEEARRGPYAGAVGYFGYSGNLDLCITIRTIVLKDGFAYLQAGAGIVADSDPAREYEELTNKAKALLRALEKAGDSFGAGNR